MKENYEDSLQEVIEILNKNKQEIISDWMLNLPQNISPFYFHWGATHLINNLISQIRQVIILKPGHKNKGVEILVNFFWQSSQTDINERISALTFLSGNSIHHLTKTVCYVKLSSELLGCSFESSTKIANAGLLHDFGKLGISKNIIQKNGVLNRQEREIMKTHAILGYKILQYFGFEQTTLDAAFYHHESFSGKGYYGTSLDDLPMCAMIVKLADVYSALREPRSYKEPFSHEKAKAIILAQKEDFSPEIFYVFEKHDKKFQEISGS